jgi:tRNA (cytidine32/uridine32-2'-O)-methyltransferase
VTLSAASPTSVLANIRIVLLNTTLSANVGAAARAMKNMGLQQLWLVAPASFPDRAASDRAAGARDLLESAVVVDTLEEAIADCGLVVGTSARTRHIPWPLVDVRRGGLQMAAEAQRHPVAVLFGREDRGLTNDELQRCQLHITIPANPDYSALNLAMAVQVVAYELRTAALSEALSDPMADWDVPLASGDDIERMFAHFERTLRAMGFLNPDAPKQAMTRLRRLFQRTRLDRMEVNILRGILNSADQWVARGRDGAATGGRGGEGNA